MRLLLVEDDLRVAAALTTALRKRGYEVTHAGGVAEALNAPPVDLVLLDLGLPDGDGLEVCRALRERSAQVGIIAVTARGDERDRVAGLNNGADDYVVKPFSMAELQARMEAVLRRSLSAASRTEPLSAGGLTLDLTARRASIDGTELSLTPKEFDILTVLARSPDVPVSRNSIAIQVWLTSWVDPHVLEVHIASLRAKLSRPGLVQTVRGVGYRLSVK